MSKTVSAVDARRTLGELLNRVSIAREEIIIERAGKKIARLVAIDETPSPAPDSAAEGLDFRTSGGLGKDIWRRLDVEAYVKAERKEWE